MGNVVSDGRRHTMMEHAHKRGHPNQRGRREAGRQTAEVWGTVPCSFSTCSYLQCDPETIQELEVLVNSLKEKNGRPIVLNT